MNELLDKPAVFICGEKEKRIKIPPFKAGRDWLKIPLYAEFKKHKFVTTSQYVASYLRGKCSPDAIVEMNEIETDSVPVKQTFGSAILSSFKK